MEQELNLVGAEGFNLDDWVETFGGEEFKRALTAAQLSAVEPQGEEGGEPSEEGEEELPEDIQAVVEKIVAKRLGKTQEEVAPAKEEVPKEEAPAAQQAPLQITEEHLRQWLGDEWDMMSEAQKKMAFLAYYNYMQAQMFQQMLEKFNQQVLERIEQIQTQSEEDQLVQELTEQLIKIGTAAGLDEDELEAVAELMEKKGILDPRTAVEYYILSKNLGSRAQSVRSAPRRQAAAPQVPAPTQQSSQLAPSEGSLKDFVMNELLQSEEGRKLLKRSVPIL